MASVWVISQDYVSKGSQRAYLSRAEAERDYPLFERMDGCFSIVEVPLVRVVDVSDAQVEALRAASVED